MRKEYDKFCERLSEPLVEYYHRRYKAGDQSALLPLIRHCYAIVVWQVDRTDNWTDIIEFDDLVQSGVIGIIKAADRWKPWKSKFSTYVRFHIRAEIEREMENNGLLIRLPTHMHTYRRKTNRVIARLTKELERPPSLEEVCEAVGCRPDVVALIIGLQDRQSIDETLNEADWGRHSWLTEPAMPFDDELIDEHIYDQIFAVINRFPEKARYSLRHWGIGGDKISLRQIANDLGYESSEGVRQLAFRTMRRLRIALAQEDITF